MIKLKELLKEKKEIISEAKGYQPTLKVPSDVSYYERDWTVVLKEWGKTDYGPRESDMYDWNDSRYYEEVKKEFNAHMDKVAAKLNKAAKDLERPVPKLSYTKDVKKLFDVMYSMAEKSGVPVRDKIENYFPQVIKEDVLKILFKDVDKMVNSSQGNILSSDRLAEKQGVEAQLRAMVSDPKALKPETIKALEYLKDKTGSYSTAFEQLRKGINSERYTINKHLEKGRELDLPNELLMRDARVVVPEYIQRWAKRLGYVESFGVQGEKMFGDINAMQSSGFHREANVLRDTFESFTNLAETNPARNYRPAIKNFWNSFVNFGIAITSLGKNASGLIPFPKPRGFNILLTNKPISIPDWNLYSPRNISFKTFSFISG